MHFLETNIAGLVANVNQFQTRHFETLAKVIDRTASTEMQKRKIENLIKLKIYIYKREREREREKRDNLDCSYVAMLLVQQYSLED